eukprot:TRINITY_DN13091_c0_g1_i1.p1 TRINITY_DN13091_c0_g1~~TRINITY_DN13091_c0_g1_i1.p1  ORF type:complete len:234 (+),score=44.73 TRINITY_DN13091_c0_g1_i1:156-857(+)
MLRSLVGSEMCIRDRNCSLDLTDFELTEDGQKIQRTASAGGAPIALLDDLLYISGRKACSYMDSMPFRSFSGVVFALNDPPLATPFPCDSSYFVDITDALDNDISPYFEPVCQYIEDLIHRFGAKARVNVHCQHGQSRSGALALAFIMKHLGCSLREAFHMVGDRKPDLKINVAFIAQLQKWEAHLTGRSRPSMSLEEADENGWCKCFFVLKDPNERGIVNLGKCKFGHSRRY